MLHVLSVFLIVFFSHQDYQGSTLSPSPSLSLLRSQTHSRVHSQDLTERLSHHRHQNSDSSSNNNNSNHIHVGSLDFETDWRLRSQDDRDKADTGEKKGGRERGEREGREVKDSIGTF